MARVHVAGRRRPYRGPRAHEILDAPDFRDRRERFPPAALGHGPRLAQVAPAAARVAHHGAGRAASAAHMLWVADPNPRAQAFYAKHGFVPDGTVRVDDGVREVRMTRPARSSAAGRRDLDEAEPAAPR